MSAAMTITLRKLVECEISARFWATQIPLYADRMRRRSNIFAVVSAVLSSITALGIWSVLTASSHWTAKLAVTLVALTSSIVAVVPPILGYAQCAEDAAKLATPYGHALGQIVSAEARLADEDASAEALASTAIADFEEVRKSKQALKPYPTDLAEELEKVRNERIQTRMNEILRAAA